MAREEVSTPKPALVGLASRAVVGHKKNISSVSWTSNGEKLLVAGDGHGVRVYDAAGLGSRDLIERDSTLFDGHKGSIEALVPCPTSPNIFATASLDQTANMYDMRVGTRPAKSLKLSSGGINMAWCPDGSYIVVGDNNDRLYLIDAKRFEVTRDLRESGKDKVMVNQMQWHRTGKVLFLARGDGQVAVHAWPTLKFLQYLSGHRANCLSIAVDPTGR